jgi:hypothetical protein
MGGLIVLRIGSIDVVSREAAIDGKDLLMCRL